ncbi:putative hexosyltransferase MUCI70 [Bidens hawaiensis]|uniref:putative hexosyltransferase MUCI70 n=1 Tax=Bidens hawaiensis TaxID=980011 RepID=UPI004049DBA4
MTSGSLGIRSSSYGSLLQHQQQIQNGQKHNQSTPPVASRKPNKMFVNKDKENMFMWMFMFLHRKKVGMMFLCLVSVAALLWVLYVGKGEVTQEVQNIQSLDFKNDSITNSSPIIANEQKVNDINSSSTNHDMKITLNNDKQITTVSPPPTTLPPSLPPPPIYFTGYTLPHGHPCENFPMPPPPAEKKRTGPRPCPVCYLPVVEAISMMPNASSFSPILQNLTYIHEENLTKSEFGGSEFGGYPSLKQRLESFDIKESMTVHCGFVKGDKPGHKTGFDIDDSDLFEMDQCRGVLVASAIFGAYDMIKQPKNISETAKKDVCFFMFVDEETASFLRNSSDLDDSKRIGLWQIVVVHNLPYSDPRRNGKVPKLLLHRLFPNVRYSLWVDGKLELVVDPYQILERFLWRENASFAISRHYKRFDVFVEAEANKAAAKYDNASIDLQIDFYRKEGLTPYSEAKLPIRSDVPEGCVVIREHIPISNLFTCLWFNEVDRFTSRDQISFSTVRDKITSKTNWTVHMFWDCQRRNFVVQGYHRDILEHWPPPPPPPLLPPLPLLLTLPGAPPTVTMQPPSALTVETPNISALETSMEHIVSNSTKIPSARRRRRFGSRRHRKVVGTTPN